MAAAIEVPTVKQFFTNTFELQDRRLAQKMRDAEDPMQRTRASKGVQGGEGKREEGL